MPETSIHQLAEALKDLAQRIGKSEEKMNNPPPPTEPDHTKELRQAERLMGQKN